MDVSPDIIRVAPLDHGVDLRVQRAAADEPNPMNGTKALHDRIVLDKFYAQHPRVFALQLGDRAGTATVLDLGCGQAYGLERWASQCGEYHGTDLSYPSLMLARKYVPADAFPNTKFYFDAVHSQQFPEQFADFLMSSEVIEHLEDPHEHLRYCFTRIKPGGWLSLSTPCVSLHLYPGYMLPALMVMPGRWYKLCNAHRYWQEVLPLHPAFRPLVLAEMLRETGFEVCRHFTCLWFWEAPLRLEMRLSRFLELLRVRSHLGLLRRASLAMPKRMIFCTVLTFMSFMLFMVKTRR